jgi:hypothetical protein
VTSDSSQDLPILCSTAALALSVDAARPPCMHVRHGCRLPLLHAFLSLQHPRQALITLNTCP